MTAYYTTLCGVCEHPIKRGGDDLVRGSASGCWHHRDLNVCRTNIREFEAARHHDGGDCECTSAMDLVAEKDAEITALKSRLLTTYGVLGGMLSVPDCGCWDCNPDERGMRMFICPECGNKRCPRATDHRNSCTGSNEPGQPGSRYGGLPT